jgi:hypothetical protein
MIECRGRNGWFKLHRASADLYQTTDLASVSLESRGQWRNVAPIYFQGPKAEIEALLMKLLEQVRAVGGPSFYCDDCARERDLSHPLKHRIWGVCPICSEGERFINHNLGEPGK